MPTPQQARDGVALAMQNADRHIEAAQVLAAQRLYGPAVAHLIYSIEETEKARSFAQVWINSWQRRRHGDASEADLRARIFDHTPRHKAAAAKSYATGPFWAIMAESTREHVRLSPTRTPEERVALAYAEHPEALPLDWDQRAGPMREAALYVDHRDGAWHTPDEFTHEDFEALRLRAAAYLKYMRAAADQMNWEFEHRPTS